MINAEQKKNGTNPVVFRISLNGKSRDIASGLSCKLSEWDYKNNRAKNNSEHLKLLNIRLRDIEIEYLEKIRVIELKHPYIGSPQKVIELIKNNSLSLTVESFWLKEIDRLELEKSFGNARCYKNSLLGFNNVTNMNIPFESINYKWLSEVQTIFIRKGLKTNTISVYMRSLRSIYNKAINFKIVEQHYYPFRTFKIANGKSKPRFLTIEDLANYFNYKPSNCKLKHAWDIGRLIFMLRGINFADLILLTNDNISSGRVNYLRAKTHKSYSIEFINEIEEVLYSYKLNCNKYLLPLLKENDITVDRVAQLRRTTNKYLKRIGNELGFSEKLTSYTFRYSWANACKLLGYSKDLISEGLGHSYGSKITSCYIEDIDLERVDEMNRTLIKHVLRKGS